MMVVATDNTYKSWWVPFEIGTAYNLDTFLSTYVELTEELPAFLQRWPQVKSHCQLDDWCDQIKQLKQQYNPAPDGRGYIKAVGLTQENYANQMNALASRFSG